MKNIYKSLFLIPFCLLTSCSNNTNSSSSFISNTASNSTNTGNDSTSGSSSIDENKIPHFTHKFKNNTNGYYELGREFDFNNDIELTLHYYNYHEESYISQILTYDENEPKIRYETDYDPNDTTKKLYSVEITHNESNPEVKVAATYIIVLYRKDA